MSIYRKFFRIIFIIFLLILLLLSIVYNKVYNKENFNAEDEYSGTAVERMNNIHKNIISLTDKELSVDWDIVRVNLLKAGGMRDLKYGIGNDSHCFTDFNHCDLTPIKKTQLYEENNGRVNNIEFSNSLGKSIEAASIPDTGPGGSWCTCMINCNTQPKPLDVAHVQFKSRIAFKLVWVPPDYNTFVLIDDSGKFLNKGNPSGNLPDISTRRKNFQLTIGSKYSKVAINIGKKILI
jgi:hypothetical protein